MINPFEELEMKFSARFDKIEQLLNNLSPKTSQERQERIGLKEAMEITGLKQSAIYQKTMKGTIPYGKFNKRLIFSRQELESWMEEKTVRKQSPEEIATKQLATVARKKETKNKRRIKRKETS